MEQIEKKFQLIFLKFLYTAVATIAGYTFLHWLLLIKMEMFTIDQEVVNLFIPMIVPGILILTWLRPSVKLLNFANNKGKDPLGLFIFLAWIAIAIPTIIAQEYLVTATGKLTVLDHISQIDTLPKTKYYKIKHFYIDKRLAKPKAVFEVTGKHNEDFDMTIYVPCPIFDQGLIKDSVFNLSQTSFPPGKAPLIVINGRPFPDSLLKRLNAKMIKSYDVLNGKSAEALYGSAARNGVVVIKTFDSPITAISSMESNAEVANAVAWVAVKFRKTINNNRTPDEKEAMYKQFAQQSQNEFNLKNLKQFVYLDRMAESSDLKNYRAAITGDKKGAAVVLSPVDEPFEARNGSKLPWIFGSLGIGSAIFFILMLFYPLKENAGEIDTTKEATADRKSAIDELKLYFVPRQGFYITPIIIDVNLIVFVIMAICGLGFISFQASDLLKLGANYRPSIEQGQYWRLVTNIFLHGGLMHVLMNMYGLMFVGIFIEPVIGTGRFTVAYFVTGVAASIASVWWHPATVSIGASGAIFGMYGVFLALLTTNLFPAKFKKTFLVTTSVFVGYNLLYGLTGGIDNAAHIGGLFSGFLAGYLIYFSAHDQLNQQQAEEDTQYMLNELTDKKSEE